MRPMPQLLRLVPYRRRLHATNDKEKKNEENATKDAECRDGIVEQDALHTVMKDDIPPFLEPLTYVEMDAAGPVFDKQSLRILYNLCQKNFGNISTDGGRYSILDHLQTTHLHSIALSNNLATTIALPTTLANMALQTCIPSVYLKRRLIALAEDIILDDIALIEEGHLRSECIGLTNDEVLEACWIRGLPVGRFVGTMSNHISYGRECHRDGNEGELQMMRRVLMHHLQMMETIMACRNSGGFTRDDDNDDDSDTIPILRSRRELVRDNTLLLLVLHLPAIRYSMRHS